MKRFEDLCRMTQPQLKNYMKQYLDSKGYSPIAEDGFLYAKGDIPVLLVAHLDTVHAQKCGEIITHESKMYSPQGIGGDDRCGVYMIANIVRNFKCSVLLCEDEEEGMIGADKFTNTEYVNELGVNYMIEFDRKGSNDAVFYSCGNNEFIDFVLDNTGYKEEQGSFTDISMLMPASGICGVNLSCGYYKPHTTDEYVVYDEMMHTVSVATKLIQEECAEPFKYVAKKYSGYTLGKPSNRKTIIELIKEDKYLTLEAVISDEYGIEYTIYGTGETKAECWMDLFLEHPDICMNQIIDFNFM
jgi:hypothetical protein